MRDLRRQLPQSECARGDVQSLDEALRALQAMGNQTVTRPGCRELSAAALDNMKKLEFELRKATDTSSDELFVSGGDATPRSPDARGRLLPRASRRETGTENRRVKNTPPSGAARGRAKEPDAAPAQFRQQLAASVPRHRERWARAVRLR